MQVTKNTQSSISTEDDLMMAENQKIAMKQQRKKFEKELDELEEELAKGMNNTMDYLKPQIYKGYNFKT